MIGVYRIINKKNDKKYFGSSKNIEKRFRDHKNKLKRNNHENIILQRAWNKYGEEFFLFEIVELCDKELLFETEQKYLNISPEYNIGINASGGDNISNHPHREDIIKRMIKSVKNRYDSMTDIEKKEKHSKPREQNPNWRGGTTIKYCACGHQIQSINKTCIKCRNKSGVNNPFYNKNHSIETKNKLSKKRMGKKPANMRKIIIKGLVYESLAEASRQTGIPSPTILWRVNSNNKKFIDYQSHESIKAELSN